jgi:hypothetical protein
MLGVDNSQAIIEILRPVWGVGYDQGYADGSD